METLAAAAESAYHTFLTEIADVHYAALRDGINKLAVADCLVSLAQVSLQPGYVSPIFCDTTEDIFEVVGGRHPMLEAVHSDPHVPNDACLGGASPRSKIITGANDYILYRTILNPYL
jgi:DNA mismatch repair protein MSH3